MQTAIKDKACAQCGTMFRPFSSTARVCSPTCARRWVKVEKVAERAKTKERKEKLKTTREWEAECRAIVQAIARLRDKDDGCISCHMPADYKGMWHGSHFRSVAAASAVQLNLWNVHKSCAQCNLMKSGNIAAYAPRLVAKIGQEKVDWLMSQNQIVRRDPEYFKRFKKVMGKRLRRMKATDERH